MRIFDIHPHIISDDAVRYPRAPLGGKQSKWSEEHAVGYDDMLREMDATGVEKSVLVQSSTCYGFDNSYVAAAIAAHPDRFSGVCSIDALAPDAPEKLAHWVSRGFRGVRLFVSGASFASPDPWFADEKCDPFWSKAIELGIPVCLQLSWAMLPQIKQVLARFPEVRVILDHMLRPPVADGPPYEQAAELFALGKTPNVFLKLTPFNVKEIRQAGGEGAMETLLPRLVQAFGASRIAWGSNFPSTTHTLQEAYDMVWEATSGLSDSDREFIFGKTALSLYPNLA